MTEVQVRLTMTEARELVDEVRSDAAMVWAKLLDLYEGGGHLALGYTSWATFCEAELDMSKSHGYRLLDAGRVARMAEGPPEPTHEVIPPVGESAPTPRESRRAERAAQPSRELPAPANERVARKLAATARTDPERALQVWTRAVEQHGPQATPEQVAAIANGSPNGHVDAEPEPDDSWRDEMRALAADLRRVAKTTDPKDARRALARWRAAYARLDKIAKEGR